MFMEALSGMNVSNISLAITIKHRRAAGEVESMNIVGEIKGKHCIIVDDMIDTAGTLCKAADSLTEMGALSVSACCTHALFSGPALERIGKCTLKNVIVSDTIPRSAPQFLVHVCCMQGARTPAHAGPRAMLL
jgi:ribose-phosphate pyrophosphokinase